MNIYVTGAVSFAGTQVALRSLDRGYEVVGIARLNDYYDVQRNPSLLTGFKNSIGGFKRGHS